MMSESMAGIYSQPDAFKVEENLSSIILEWEKMEGRILATTTSVANALEILGTNARYVSEQVGHMAEKLTAASAAMGALAASQQVGSGGVGDGVSGSIAVSNTIDGLEAFFKKYDKVEDAFETLIKSKGKDGLKPVFFSILPETTDEVLDLFEDLGGGLQAVFGKIGSLFSGMRLGWGVAIAAVVAGIAILIQNWDKIKAAVMTILDGVIQFIAGVFTGNLQAAGDGVVKVFQGVLDIIGGVIKLFVNYGLWVVNKIIAVFYSVVGGFLNFVDGIGAVIAKLKGENVDHPYRVTMDPPQIPYLAQGAVLPANEPFMAVVGDQKHGTNVEAPLATIQEAVAIVMADMLPAMVAGFEAVVTEQRALRGAVEELEIGDQVIGQAAQRYAQRMAVIRGGAV